MKESDWQASTGEASSWDCWKEKEKREEKLGRGTVIYEKSDQFSGSTRSAKEQNSQKPTQMLFRFLAQRPRHQKISCQRGKLEQKSSDFWTKFQKQKRWIAAAVNRYLIYLRLGLLKKGSSEVASPFRPFCSSIYYTTAKFLFRLQEARGARAKIFLHLVQSI